MLTTLDKIQYLARLKACLPYADRQAYYNDEAEIQKLEAELKNEMPAHLAFTVRSHGHSCHVLTCGNLLCSSVSNEADIIPPNLTAVRQWLGY